MWDKSTCSTVHGENLPLLSQLIILNMFPVLSACRAPSAAVDSLEPPKSSAGHHARVFDVAFLPEDSSLLASASDDDTCKVWRINDSGATQAASFHGHQDSVLRVSWAPTGDLLASGMHTFAT